MRKTKSTLRKCVQGVAASLLFFTFGCGGPQTYPVQGIVTYNGSEVPTGWVSFVKEGSDPVSGEIASDGTYSLEAEPGAYLVGISAPRQFPPGTKPEDAFKMTLPPPYVPPGYNSSKRSGLKAVVEAQEENVVDFSLKPIGRKRRR